MLRSIAFKLLLAFLAVSLAGTALVAILTGRATASEFGYFMMDQNQISLASDLEDYYRAYGTWEGAATSIGGPGGGGPGMGMGRMHAEMVGSFAVADASGVIVAEGEGYRLGAQLTAAQLAAGLPLTVEGQRVGTLFLGRSGFGPNPLSEAGALFLARVNRALLLGSLGATALALCLALLFANALARPVRELTQAARAIAQGRLEQQVAVRSRDELGQLAAAFNQMSADLAHARDLRRQMTADIAHELRTPLSVILGHAEGLREGVLRPTPEILSLVHDEALRLNRLVDDLRTLSLAEAGELSLNPRRVDLRALLERAAAAHSPRAQQNQVAVTIEVEADLPDVSGDSDRLAQVVGNCLDNALRHTPAGGRVVLGAARSPGGVRLSVSDTGPGISPEDLPHVFERFYRADKSRGRTSEPGGSGLGLAIAQSIVAGHGGKIWVESQPGRGAAILVELPAAREPGPASGEMNSGGG